MNIKNWLKKPFPNKTNDKINTEDKRVMENTDTLSRMFSNCMNRGFINLKNQQFFLNNPKTHLLKQQKINLAESVTDSIFHISKIRETCSYMQNIKLVINNHNMKVLNETAEIK